MRTLIGLPAIALLALLAGCQNHPLVDDMTGYTTQQVVHKLQCEAQAAMLQWLRTTGLTRFHKAVLERLKDREDYYAWHARHYSVISKIVSGMLEGPAPVFWNISMD